MTMAAAENGLKVGSEIWRFDENHRIYKKDANGRSNGGPIYREHWRSTTIQAETTKSWITVWGEKVPKRGPHPGYAFSASEVDDHCWVHGNRYSITRAVDRCKDANALRRIAELVGWKENLDAQ